MFAIIDSRKDKNGVRQPRQNRRANIKLSTSLVGDVTSPQHTLQSTQQPPHAAQIQPPPHGNEAMSPLYTGSSNQSFDLRKLIKGESSASPTQCSVNSLPPAQQQHQQQQHQQQQQQQHQHHQQQQQQHLQAQQQQQQHQQQQNEIPCNAFTASVPGKLLLYNC